MALSTFVVRQTVTDSADSAATVTLANGIPAARPGTATPALWPGHKRQGRLFGETVAMGTVF